jgi:hypothetical protein
MRLLRSMSLLIIVFVLWPKSVPLNKSRGAWTVRRKKCRAKHTLELANRDGQRIV